MLSGNARPRRGFGDGDGEFRRRAAGAHFRQRRTTSDGYAGEYAWRHTDMSGARTAAEEGAQRRGRRGVLHCTARLTHAALARSRAVDAAPLRPQPKRGGGGVRARR
jgi:hypothetical protein